jgi:hypothetical protein
MHFLRPPQEETEGYHDPNSLPRTAAMILPSGAEAFLPFLVPHFTHPSLVRVQLVLVAAVLTTGRRTGANLRRTLAGLARGHRTSDQRPFSSARWSALRRGLALARYLVGQFLPDGPVRVVVDDTAEAHPGKQVDGKARHRDAARSSHSDTAWRYGHKWVVLAVLVRFPFATRPGALPVLVALDRSPELNRKEGHRHRTPAQRAVGLLRLRIRSLPDRRFLLAGDSASGTHEVARFCYRDRDRLTLVSQCHPEVNLFAPPVQSGRGRPRVKGERRPQPAEVVAGRPPRSRRRRTVPWYGGGDRRVAVLAGVGHWYKSGRGLVPIRWVFVEDRSGTHREESFPTTDPARTPREVIDHDCGRWNIETTFQECRSALGWETTRGGCKNTVRRAAPCRFGLYSVVAGLFTRVPDLHRVRVAAWPGKFGVSFSDALASVRWWFWAEGVFPQADIEAEIQELSPEVRNLLLAAMTPAT